MNINHFLLRLGGCIPARMHENVVCGVWACVNAVLRVPSPYGAVKKTIYVYIYAEHLKYSQSQHRSCINWAWLNRLQYPCQPLLTWFFQRLDTHHQLLPAFSPPILIILILPAWIYHHQYSIISPGESLALEDRHGTVTLRDHCTSRLASVGLRQQTCCHLRTWNIYNWLWCFFFSFVFFRGRRLELPALGRCSQLTEERVLEMS
jgi:hypothetical protein